MNHTHTTTVRVRYAETDSMRVVHHRNYIVYFEAARSALMRAHGISYAEMERQGSFLAILELGARYLAPAHYDEVLLVSARVTSVAGARVRFEYRVRRRDADGAKTLCEGFTVLGCLNNAGRPRRLPKATRDCLDQLAGAPWPADGPGGE